MHPRIFLKISKYFGTHLPIKVSYKGTEMCINIPYLTKVATQKLSNQLMAHPKAMDQRLLFQNCLSFYL